MAPASDQATASADAAVVRGVDQEFQIERVSVSGLGPQDVLVKVAGAGICHTDLVLRGPAGAQMHPVVLGHEGSGTVAAVGSSVRHVTTGDHVVMSYDSCGRCTSCLSGRPYYCQSWFDLNFGAALTREHAAMTDAHGGEVRHTLFGQSSFATHAVATENNVVKVDGSLPLEILGPLGCGLQTGAGAVTNVLEVRPGRSLVVFGAGAVGLAAIMAAKICGAQPVVAVDVVDSRLELAKSLGATHTVDGRASDLAEQVAAITGGADCAFDTTGKPAVIRTAVNSLRQGGTCALVAFEGPLEVATESIVFGRTVTGVVEGAAIPAVFIPQMIEWWRAGLFPFDRLIERFPLSDINAAAQAADSGRVVKPVLIP